MALVDVNGRKIGSGPASNKAQQRITQTQAGAIMISEIEIALTRWNTHNLELAKASGLKPEDADLFEVDFKQYAYTTEIQEKQKQFGYAELKIWHVKHGKQTPIYTKAMPFERESDLANKNAYFPNMAIDCLGFLLASGLMYNLALIPQNPTKVKEPANASETKKATGKREPAKKSKPGTGPVRKAGKGDS